MSRYSQDLWDRYSEVAKRFEDGMAGTVSFGKMASSVMEIHKSNSKSLSKVKLRTEDYGGMEEYMKKIIEYYSSIGKLDNSLIEELKALKDEISTKNKALKKELSKQHKIESKTVKTWEKTKNKFINIKKADLQDALKWTRIRQNLIASEQSYTPNEKQIKKETKIEKKNRENSIKTRDKYEQAVKDFAIDHTEFYKTYMTHLSGIEIIDLEFVDRQKQSVVNFVGVMEKYLQDALNETQKLKEIMLSIKPEKLISEWVKKTKTGKKPPPIKFKPYIKEKSHYTAPLEQNVGRDEGEKDSDDEEESDEEEQQQQPKKEESNTFDDNDDDSDSSSSEDNDIQQEQQQEQQQQQPEEQEYDIIEVVTSTADYDANSETELSLKYGDSINVYVKGEDGWWYGEINGSRGYFPYNYTSAYEE